MQIVSEGGDWHARFACNVKARFLGKWEKKYHQFVVCWISPGSGIIVKVKAIFLSMYADLSIYFYSVLKNIDCIVCIR